MDGTTEVAAFKPGLKHQGIIIGSLWYIERHNLAFGRLALLIRRRINGVEDHSVKEVLLVGDPVGLAAERLFKDELLGRIQRFEVKALLDVEGWVLHVFHSGSCLHINMDILQISYP